ncbi:MAG: hypothetical protein ACRC8Y_16685 [Chroococcales cyanobacterium]
MADKKAPNLAQKPGLCPWNLIGYRGFRKVRGVKYLDFPLEQWRSPF